MYAAFPGHAWWFCLMYINIYKYNYNGYLASIFVNPIYFICRVIEEEGKPKLGHFHPCTPSLTAPRGPGLVLITLTLTALFNENRACAWSFPRGTT